VVAHLPWQTEQWRRLTSALAAGQLGHANLFSGRAGAGHEEFAQAFAKFLLCEQSNEPQLGASTEPCNECRGCLLSEAGNHPDLLLVTPEEEGKIIGVDQIRALSSFYSLKSHYGGNKLAIIMPADAMNRAASNAILKTLEEPPNQASLILVTDRFDAMSMTVRSRCQRTAFEHIDQNAALEWLTQHVPDRNEAVRLLDAALGAPLKALELRDSDEASVHQELLGAWSKVAAGVINPLKASKMCTAFPIKAVIEELLRLNYLLILAKYDLSGAFSRQEEKAHLNLQAPLDGLDLRDLYAILDVILEGKKLILSRANVRESDLLDSLWIALDGTYRKSNGA